MHRFIPLCCLLLLACAAERDPASLFGPTEQGTIVVDAVLLVDHPFPDVFVRQTVSPDVAYTQDVAAVRGAEVIVIQGNNEYRYTEAPGAPGRYQPPANPPFITPQTEYHLLVRIGVQEIRATTTTPDRFFIDEVVMVDVKTLEKIRNLKTFRDDPAAVFTAPENQVVYQENLLQTLFAPIDVQAYQVGIFSLDMDSDFVIEGDFLDEDDFETFERRSSSPPFEVADGVLRLPWFAIFFAGRYMIKVYALDENWFDFARSSPEQQNAGFGNLAGDNFERPIFRVDGGIGLFGSASVDSLGFVVLPKDGS